MPDLDSLKHRYKYLAYKGNVNLVVVSGKEPED